MADSTRERMRVHFTLMYTDVVSNYEFTLSFNLICVMINISILYFLYRSPESFYDPEAFE